MDGDFMAMLIGVVKLKGNVLQGLHSHVMSTLQYSLLSCGHNWGKSTKTNSSEEQSFPHSVLNFTLVREVLCKCLLHNNQQWSHFYSGHNKVIKTKVCWNQNRHWGKPDSLPLAPRKKSWKESENSIINNNMHRHNINNVQLSACRDWLF